MVASAMYWPLTIIFGPPVKRTGKHLPGHFYKSNIKCQVQQPPYLVYRSSETDLDVR